MSPTNKDGHYSDPTRHAAGPQESEEDLTAAYVSNLDPIKKQRQKSKRVRIILIALVVLAVVGAGVYFFLSREKPAPQQPAQSTQQQAQPAEDAPLETYESEPFGLTFKFPNNWEIDDKKPNQLTVTSPIVPIKDESGTDVQGRVVLSFNTGASKVPGFGATNGTAVLESEKLSYDTPSQSQRKQTYLSFVNFTGGQGMQDLYITGDSGYKKGQAVPEVDVKKVDPIIRVTFEACEGEVCGGETLGPLTVSTAEWKANPALIQAEKILKSLTVQ